MKRVAKVRQGADPHWVGDGFPVRTFFSYDEGPAISPFLLLDYAGPTEFGPAPRPRGVGPHPHRGFETVTVVYQGEVEHRDSAGHGGKIGPGDVQWMTAAGGLVHEEMHSRAFTASGGTLEMVQLWVNLPAQHKMSPPRYQDLASAQIPAVPLEGHAGTLRVIAGQFLGNKGPASTFTPIELWDVQLRAGKSTQLPIMPGHTAMLLVQKGSLRIGDTAVKATQMGVLEREGDVVELVAPTTDARLLLLAGEPIHEPVVGYGPFVMNTKAEIGKAIEDYQSGRMGQLAT